MKVIPIAADSLGVRSMATYVETKELKIFIDPGAALGPSRYGLPPAKEEWQALDKAYQEIDRVAKLCDVLIISHYHYDHHDPNSDFYKGKKVFAKNRLENINLSQKERGKYFEERVIEKCKLVYCDSQEFEFKNLKIKFSEPFYHGVERTRLGFVLMTSIEENNKFKFLYTSDVQGPVSKQCCEYIIKEKPDLLYVDGPPTLFLGWKFSYKNLEVAIENLLRIIKELNCEIILDHHLLRDLRYKELLSRVYAKGNVKSCAEYLGVALNMLEARRKELWSK
ncbi:MAG: MBL fold metallo-hydrolase [Candidatus Thermoplasmatota archaeon]|nr:MBL fold metallo-hydrolase [Candidatus Thermoplasmatota archaeon]